MLMSFTGLPRSTSDHRRGQRDHGDACAGAHAGQRLARPMERAPMASTSDLPHDIRRACWACRTDSV